MFSLSLSLYLYIYIYIYIFIIVIIMINNTSARPPSGAGRLGKRSPISGRAKSSPRLRANHNTSETMMMIMIMMPQR